MLAGVVSDAIESEIDFGLWQEVIDEEDGDRELLEEAKEGIMQRRNGHQEG